MTNTSRPVSRTRRVALAGLSRSAKSRRLRREALVRLVQFHAPEGAVIRAPYGVGIRGGAA